MLLSKRKLLRHRLTRSRQENDLAVCSLSHRLHSFQVSDLHSRSRREDIGGLSHQFGALDFGAGLDDLCLTGSLALGGHGQRVLELLAEDDVLDQHTFYGDTPAGCCLFDDFADALGDFFAALDYILEDAGADDVAEGGLGSLDEGEADVRDAEGCLVRARDVVVDDGSEGEVDVVLRGLANRSMECDRYLSYLTLVMQTCLGTSTI